MSTLKGERLTSPITAELRNLTQSIGVKLGFFFSGYKTTTLKSATKSNQKSEIRLFSC